MNKETEETLIMLAQMHEDGWDIENLANAFCGGVLDIVQEIVDEKPTLSVLADAVSLGNEMWSLTGGNWKRCALMTSTWARQARTLVEELPR